MKSDVYNNGLLARRKAGRQAVVFFLGLSHFFSVVSRGDRGADFGLAVGD